MEESEINGKKRRGPYLLLEQRLRLYHKVLQLREQGLSYNRIQRIIYTHNGVRIPRATIIEWTHKEHHPLGNVNRFDDEPSPELAYVIGVRFSDGWLSKYVCNYIIGLDAKDYEFVAQVGQKLAKLLGRKKPYKPWWNKRSCLWRVTGRSILLYELLSKPWQNQRSHIEANMDCVVFFLRAIFDGEGSISGKALTIHNTDKKLLIYVRQLIRRYFGIKATGPHKSTKPGHRFHVNGEVYQTKKQEYYLYIPVDSLMRFRRCIGFTIRRKQRKLIEATQR